MLNTFEKTKAHEARRAAIQRQMEAMEAAASSRNVGSQQPPGVSVTTARRRTNQGSSDPGAPAGSLETARRFLWDEDEEPAAGGDTMTQNLSKGGRENDSRSSSAPKESSGGLFKSFFGGKASTGQNRAQSSKTTPVNLNDASSRAGEDDNEYRPSLLTSCYVSFRGLMLGCALSIGSCYIYFKNQAERMFSNGRGKRLCLVLALILAVAIPTAIFAPKFGSSSAKSSPEVTLRFDTIARNIIEGGISTPEEIVTFGTPQHKAMQWIVSDDPAQMDPENHYLLQRYALAVFYYSTHGENMFQTATVNLTETRNPAGGDEETDPRVGDIVPLADGETQVMGDDLAAQPTWVNENGWMSGAGICSWYGIECHHRTGTSVFNTRYDGNNGVILFNMTENNVRGKFPKEIFAALKDIRWLSLSGNGFFGTVPSGVDGLDQLRYLSLSNNFFTGVLPDEISALTYLNRLYLDGNYLEGTLPPSLGKMTSLVSFSVYNNFFSGMIPSTLENLQNMTALYLDINHLTGELPTGLGKLTNLVDLRLRHNRLVGTIPTEYGKLDRLEILYLDRNTLTGTIPTTLGKLTSIIEFHAYRNKLAGSIPSEIGSMRDVTSIYLDNNHLTGGIPTEFGLLKDLEQVYLHKNLMNGTIPSEIGLMENLRNFRVYTNGIKGKIPDEVGKAFKLEDFYVQDNLLTGTLPVSMAELTRLGKIRLYWNHLSGTVPAEICALKQFKVTELKADCGGDVPELSCTCCTACFA